MHMYDSEAAAETSTSQNHFGAMDDTQLRARAILDQRFNVHVSHKYERPSSPLIESDRRCDCIAVHNHTCVVQEITISLFHQWPHAGSMHPSTGLLKVHIHSRPQCM